MCDMCKKGYCRLSGDLWRQIFFNFYTGKQIFCHDFEPKTYHGLEGVYT